MKKQQAPLLFLLLVIVLMLPINYRIWKEKNKRNLFIRNEISSNTRYKTSNMKYQIRICNRNEEAENNVEQEMLPQKTVTKKKAKQQTNGIEKEGKKRKKDRISKSKGTKVGKKQEKEVARKEIATKEYKNHMKKRKSTKDKRKWYITYKKIVEKNKDCLSQRKTMYDCFSNNELQLLFSVVQAEIGDQYSFVQKCNVASVIFNRLKHKRFPNDMMSILTKDQFCTIRNGRYKKFKVSDTTVLACEYAYEIEDTAKGCLFFDSNRVLKYKFVFHDGAHNFYRLHELPIS